METYGRNRQSLEDIEATLLNIFEKRSDAKLNDDGEPVVPAGALMEILDAFSDAFNGTPLLGDEEIVLLERLLEQNPDLQMTPTLVVGLVAQISVTQPSPPRSPGTGGRDSGNELSDDDQQRGTHMRTISTDSSTSTVYTPASRPPSRGPMTPGGMKSLLDSDRRQRSTPLHTNNAPSSWPHKRPTPAGRRKSDAGNRSDSESSAPPVAFRNASNSNINRTPSVPSSPSASYDQTFSPGSRRPSSRPHSRTRSTPNTGYNSSFDLGYTSPEDTVKRPMSHYGAYDDSFDNAVSSLPMPRGNEFDSDDEDMDVGLGLVMDRSKTISTVSMEATERLEALQRTNEDLSRKCVESERALQHKIDEHEIELAEIHARLEELRTELTASNREEKELRAKDSRNMAQIAILEAEVAKVQKSLESAKATYTSLQKQYQEQCAFSEKYRDDLRKRDETIRALREAVSMHEIETGKWAKEHDSYEERITQLEVELAAAMEAYTQLDEQKQENLLLKETIDRMRFDMDEMRHAMAPGGNGTSGHSSSANTISKSLGAELMGQMNWEMHSSGEGDVEELGSETSTAIDEEETEVEEDEDVIQTIITKRKRKVASRANVIETRRTFEELKEYSDSAIQYDPTLFAVNHGMQTEPEPKLLTASFSIQTDPIPEVKALPPPPPRITVEMEIQTEEVEAEAEVEAQPSRSPSPAHDESLASSSSTIVPPTPKARTKALDPLDAPPAYNQVTAADVDWRAEADTLKKWHRGLEIPLTPVAGGVSEEALEEWKALKAELGVDCVVIDKLLAASASRAEGSRAAAGMRAGKEPEQPKGRRGRFYNIYNTYVYGDKAGAPAVGGGIAGQAMMFVGASALVLLAITPYIAPQYAGVPGGATYYDRAAWNSFNSIHGGGEVFAPDGTAAVWNFLGRVGGGAARIARGWPT